MPQMGTSIVEGTVIGWHKVVGDTVAVDEVLCEISTDKVDSECPSPAAGVLVEILVGEGETVDVGTVIARVSVDGDGPASSDGAEPTPVLAAAAANGSTRPAPASGGRRFSPVVSRLAAAHDVDLSAVPATGRGGRVTKKDVLAFIGAAEPSERPLHSESPYRPEPLAALVEPPRRPASDTTSLGGTVETLSRMRQSIAAAMLRSQETSATAHTVVECEMMRVERRRRELGVTALPIVARAVVDALRDFPDLNATLDGNELTCYDRVHLGIAVSLGPEGLIVPVVHDAQDLSEEGIAHRIKDLATRARDKALKPHEVQGATFTITSPGSAGALLATPILDVPRVGILDMEAIVRRPVVVTDDLGNESIAIRSMAYFVLGWDHRAIDGMYAAHFLTAVRRHLEGI